MKRGWVRILFLALVFVIGAAAAALRVLGVATVEDARFQQKNQTGIMEIDTQLLTIVDGKDAIPVDACAQLLTERLPANSGARYNFIIINSQGTVLYRLNDEFVSSDRIQLYQSGSLVLLKDAVTDTTIDLNVSSTTSDTSEPFLFEPDNLSSFTSHENYHIAMMNLKGRIYLWMYDDAAEKYLKVTYPAMLRARGELMLTLCAAAFTTYWLVLALWVFWDARRLGSSGWKWGGWTLASNIVGFVAYIIARSYGFGPGPCCAQCGLLMERGWLRCPYCGDKSEEQL